MLVSSATCKSSPNISTAFVTYEQPLNEHMRLYLRLEKRFNQLNNNRKCSTIEQSKTAVESLLKITDLADRPDLKTKLIQTLNQQANTLSQLAKHPNIDATKLAHLQNLLLQLIEQLNSSGCNKLVESLRRNPFLKSIRLQLGNPAGICDFNVPAYTLWLTRTRAVKEADISRWIKETEALKLSVNTLLRLTRESDSTEDICTEGFYHQALDPNLPCQMVRIHVPVEHAVYPEISLSKHRLAIRFKSLNPHDTENASADTKEKLTFRLSCCRL